jgi:two-component system, sensor histidine kinase LadS
MYQKNQLYSPIFNKLKSEIMKIQYFLPVLIFLFPVSSALSQIILTDKTRDVLVTGDKVRIWEDSTGKTRSSLADTGKFSSFKGSSLQNKNISFVYWIRADISDRSSKGKKWVLETLTPNIQILDVYISEKNQLTEFSSGLNGFSGKIYAHKNYIFDLPSGNSDYTIFIKAFSSNYTGLEFKIRDQHYFTWYALHEYYFLGIYYGILLIMLVYNFLLFITNREKLYLFYSIYVVSILFLSLTEDGLGVQLLWPSLARYNLYFYYYAAPSLFIIASAFYARNFLNLYKNFRLADRILLILTSVVILSVIAEAVTGKTFELPSLYIVPFIYIYIISMFVFVKGYKPARFFILGYSIVFVCLIVFQLRLLKLIEPDIFTVYILNYGILAEVIVLSAALGERFRLIRKEKEDYNRLYIDQLHANAELQKQLFTELEEKHLLSEKVNRELEQKVSERTAALQKKTDELTESNLKLEMIGNQLKEMNIKLDLDNWDLKKKVKQERVARIVSDEISFENFIKTFPDQNSCLRYLEELKWNNGYACIKCGNDKYSGKLFTRKCTKCNYVESPTSNTLFHGIKIPLPKAFYITYTTTRNQEKYTLEELSEILDIGRNTCWDFRKKIKERQSEVKKKFKLKDIADWEILIRDQVSGIS